MPTTLKEKMAVQLREEIDELKRKLALLEGDRKAYQENSQYSIEQNKEKIAKLRSENKQLRVKLANRMKADDDVVLSVFQKHSVRQPAELRGVTGETAIRLYDQMVCELFKRYNALQYKSKQKEETLAALETQQAQMKKEADAVMATPVGDSAEAQKLRTLENRLEKSMIKCNEATHIRRTYEYIEQKLQQERLHFDNQIAELEKAIKQRKQNLQELQSMCHDAQTARDIAKGELQRQEELNVRVRKEKEKELMEYKRQADEKKEFAERVERRLNRMSLSNQDDATVVGHEGPSEEEDQEAKITSYEEALMKIKDATGVASIQEVVERFLSQGATRQHLDSLKEDNARQIERLREERDRLRVQFEEMKYSGEAKMSSGQRLLEEFQVHLEEAKAKTSESEAQSDKAARLLGALRAGVEHLAEKVQPLKTPQTHTLKPKLDPLSSEYVLDLLSTCEQKLVLLIEELSSHDLDTLQKEMEDDEFRTKIESHIPPDNTRITLPKDSSQASMFRDDSDSGSDEEFVSREKMKLTAQAVVDAKTKKKPADDDDAVPVKKRR